MHRNIAQNLIAWKYSAYRKPLLLRGARQTGKTWVLREFGSAHYEKTHYVNFEDSPEIADFFRRSLQPARILPLLGAFLKSPIEPERHLLVFDEVQACGEALSSLKYFAEQAPQYHLAAAGSLLGVKMAKPGTFPVGKVDILELRPMTFTEFLGGVGEERYRTLLDSIDEIAPLPEPFHNDLIELLRAYYLTGGMPEAVQRYADTRDFAQVRTVHGAILTGYEQDFAKHAPTTDIPKLSHIWDSIPTYLARENKRFLFSALRKGGRGRDYEAALRWLQDAGLVQLAHCVSTVGLPLTSHLQRNLFKAYALDTGMLATKARIPIETVLHGNELFTTYHGAFVESFVAQQLRSQIGHELAYWKSETHVAEVDFLLELGSEVLPLEVKAGVNPHSKSLRSFVEKFKPSIALRSTLLNLRRDGAILNIPLYAVEHVTRLARLAQK